MIRDWWDLFRGVLFLCLLMLPGLAVTFTCGVWLANHQVHPALAVPAMVLWLLMYAAAVVVAMGRFER